jgi:hypothetical protein
MLRKATAMIVHPFVEKDRGAVDERVQHQPSSQLAALVREL